MGVINQGVASVRESWRQIFSSSEHMHFEIQDEQRDADVSLSVHIVTENIYLHGDPQPRPPIIATNIYKLTELGWKMILHHASPSVIRPYETDANSLPNKHLH